MLFVIRTHNYFGRSFETVTGAPGEVTTFDHQCNPPTLVATLL
jgi:hypothetical protein